MPSQLEIPLSLAGISMPDAFNLSWSAYCSLDLDEQVGVNAANLTSFIARTMIKFPEEQMEPIGWFRWLHDQYAGRGPWRGEIRKVDPDAQLESLHAADVARHSWQVGFEGRVDILERFWSTLTPGERGSALSGLSERYNSHDWIAAHLGDCAFDAVATAELVCNAIRREELDLAEAVLVMSGDLKGEVTRYAQLARKTHARFSESLSQLSGRCIDLVLEAALISKNERAIALALDCGASPDLPIWILERSYNEKHCALSFCIANELRASADKLLSSGANPCGIPFCGPNRPLFEALSSKQDAFAIKLLKKQATFTDCRSATERSCRIAEVRRTKPGLIALEGDYFFGYREEDLSWVEDSIGSLIALVPVAEKPCFYNGNAQGGTWTTFLNVIGGDVERLKHFEAHGLDTRLSAEEFLLIVEAGQYDKLLYLLRHEPESIRSKIIFQVRRRNPSFGQ